MRRGGPGHQQRCGLAAAPIFLVATLLFRLSQAFAGHILVTGGAGYIGSHTCCELLRAGKKIVVVDNLVNSVKDSLDRVEEIAGARPGDLVFRELDLTDRPGVERLFKEFEFDACIHFAGLKAVGESVAQPLRYYQNNIVGTLNLLETMDKFGCKNMVFSSSATVYGDPEKLPITEDQRLQATNPYGRTKLFIEEMLRDLHAADPSWAILILRYFNPIGAHPSGKIGEDPMGIPNNLMPFVAQVCVGRRDCLSVFGSDYATPDGTGVRDYIHVVDLAEGHVAAVDRMMEARSRGEGVGCVPVNLGTGQGVSVLELVKAMEEASGKTIPTKMADRRPGDVAALYTDPSFANRFLKWRATRGIKKMCEDTWRWQSRNPWGFRPTPNPTAAGLGAAGSKPAASA